MAVLGTANLVLPQNLANGMWDRAQKGSVIARLVGQTPMKFGDVTYMTFTKDPRAEYVGEGSVKTSDTVAFGTKTVKPHKVQVTMRFNQEVKWADEDYQLGVLSTMAEKGALALSRALDLGLIHGMNPLTATAVTSITDELTTAVTQSQELVLTGANKVAPDITLENAVGTLVGQGIDPNGIAFDPKLAWTFATQRYADGRKVFPDMSLNGDLSAFLGLNAVTGNTVSGMPELTDTKLRAIVGDWNALKWGVQRRVPIELIEFGDPDGQGDLKRLNQLALRLEIVYGWGLMDPDSFVLVKDAVTE